MKFSKLVILISLLAVSAGCATIKFGNEFDPAAFAEWVKRGETTQADVKARLGEPTSTGAVVENDGSYYTRWLYYYGKGKIHRLKNADFRVLEIRFNSESKVSSYNWSAPPKE